MSVDTGNRNGVAKQGDNIVILFAKSKYTDDEALNLAAWILALLYDRKEEFDELLAEVLDT